MIWNKARGRSKFAMTENDGGGDTESSGKRFSVSSEPNAEITKNANEITVDDLLRRTLGTVRSHFLKFMALGALVLLPGLLLLTFGAVGIGMAIVPGEVSGPGRMAGMAVGAIVSFVVPVSLMGVVQATVTAAAIQHIRGVPVRMGQALKMTLRRIVSVCVGSVAVFVMILIGAALPILLAIASGGRPGPGGLGMTVVIGLLLMCLFYVTIPAIVVEQKGPIAGMYRSAKLGWGYLRKIAAPAILLGVMPVGSHKLFSWIESSASSNGELVLTFVRLVVILVILVLIATLSAVFYMRLRHVREGTDVEQLASVFR